VRATVLRRPGDRALMAALHGEADGARAAINRLRDASLLTEVRVHRPDGGTEPRFEVHPAIARLALARGDGAEALRREGHRRAGDFFEAAIPEATDISVWLDAAHHLGQVGEIDRAFDLLHPLAEALQERGRMWDSIQVLEELGDADALAPTRRYLFLGLIAESRIAFGDLPGALRATHAYQEILNDLAAADPSNAGWQRDLSVSHDRIGDVLSAQGRLDDAGTAYRASLAIREALAAADATNAGWQTDLVISCVKVAQVVGQSPEGEDEAWRLLQRALGILQRLDAKGLLHGPQRQWIDAIETMLAESR
jgi:tetratricopeptide (TPR) repeat protein